MTLTAEQLHQGVAHSPGDNAPNGGQIALSIDVEQLRVGQLEFPFDLEKLRAEAHEQPQYKKPSPVVRWEGTGESVVIRHILSELVNLAAPGTQDGEVTSNQVYYQDTEDLLGTATHYQKDRVINGYRRLASFETANTLDGRKYVISEPVSAEGPSPFALELTVTNLGLIRLPVSSSVELVLDDETQAQNAMLAETGIFVESQPTKVDEAGAEIILTMLASARPAMLNHTAINMPDFRQEILSAARR